MAELALLGLPGLFHSGVACVLDGYALARERQERVVKDKGSTDIDLGLTLLSPDGAAVPLGARFTLAVDRPIASGDRFDLVWIPPFVVGGEARLRARLNGVTPVLEWLCAQAGQGAVIVASGSAVALPLAAGLVGRQPVPLVPALMPTFQAVFPHMRLERHRDIVDYRGLLLGRGMGNGFDLLARAFDRVLSPATGHWLRSVVGGIAAGAEGDMADQIVEQARLWLEQRFTEPVSIAGLASELHVSQAALIRRFRAIHGVTPSIFLRDLRLSVAQRLLAHPGRSIDSVAAAVGYADSRTFRAMFKKATGQSAHEWRREYLSVND